MPKFQDFENKKMCGYKTRFVSIIKKNPVLVTKVINQSEKLSAKTLENVKQHMYTTTTSKAKQISFSS